MDGRFPTFRSGHEEETASEDAFSNEGEAAGQRQLLAGNKQAMTMLAAGAGRFRRMLGSD